MKNKMSRNTRIYSSLIIIIIILIGTTGIIKPGTLDPYHLLEIVKQSVPLGITSIGQSAVILSGGIDLSVGEIITMTNILAADLISGQSARTIPVVIFLLFLGSFIGALSGYLISKTKIPPMVMTFAMASIVRGGYLLYSGGAPKGRVSDIIRFIGSKRIGIIPASLIVYLILIVFVIYIFQKNKWGRSIYYIGNNEKAALYSGVPVNKRIIMIYSFSAVMAVFTGLILSGYIGVGNFDIGSGYDLNSIAASVVGGNTFNGVGNVAGSAFGALIMTVLSSVLTSLGIAETGKLIMRGLIIIVMVTIYSNKGFKLSSIISGFQKGDQDEEPEIG